jgi:hypothetical protein
MHHLQTATEQFPHGSPAGYRLGCRTRATCPHGNSSELLSCAEAIVKRRGDYRYWRLPAEQPLTRFETACTVGVGSTRSVSEVHGTRWGYARGCRNRQSCPNWRRDTMTCSEANQRYNKAYASSRLAGEGTPVDHGTSNGYLLGCRDRSTCPGDSQGKTCPDARAQYKEGRARAAGIPPRIEAVDARAATEKLRSLKAGGLSLRRIAALTGCGRTTISDLLAEGDASRSRITPATLDRILSLELALLEDPAPHEAPYEMPSRQHV